MTDSGHNSDQGAAEPLPADRCALVKGLLDKSAYAHATSSIHLVETHCAWVLLTGEFAYKVKKPVDFGFLDFSTLDKRRLYCNEEVRLNRRFAPDIYLDVVAITGEPAHPEVAGHGPILEYAVRMRQFAENGLLSELAEERRLDEGHIDQIIDRLARFHLTAEHADPASSYGTADGIHHWVTENFQHIEPMLEEAHELERLHRIRDWANERRRSLDPVFRQRRKDGWIRECHGDLHLGNLTLIEGKVVPFDCIEFNPELRWIDVCSEVAFLVMDLEDRGYRSLGNRFLNGYLQQTGDYQGLSLMRYYLVYRAMVRAKVCMLRRQQEEVTTPAFRQAGKEYEKYVTLAERYMTPERPVLLITHGLSGSGKSTMAAGLCELTGLIQLRSDVERKRMAGLAAQQGSGSEPGGRLYSEDWNRRTYERLAELARGVLRAGFGAIIDATFLQRRYRDRFRMLAEEFGVKFLILSCAAPDEELDRRVRSRAAAGTDASEANLDVLAAQRRAQEVLDAAEIGYTIRMDTRDMTGTDGWRLLADRLKER